jgi:plastocyanin domain-containing protein
VKNRSFYAVILSLIVLSSVASQTVAKPRRQSLTVKINERGYEPTKLTIRKGVRTRVTFVRTTDATCAKEIVLADFNIKRELPLNQPVVMDLTPTKSGTFTFVCGMNMMSGHLIVQ